MVKSNLISDTEYVYRRDVSFIGGEEGSLETYKERIIQERAYLTKKEYIEYKLLFVISLLVYLMSFGYLVKEEREGEKKRGKD